jgi:hypothetical protein
MRIAVQCPLTAEWIAVDESDAETLADGTRYVSVRCTWCDAYGTVAGDEGYDPNTPQIHIYIIE